VVKHVNRFLYCSFSAVATGFGLISILHRRAAIPFAQYHAERELGASAILVGLIAFWCIVNYENRRGIHAALIVFSALLSLIHIQDFMAGHRPLSSALYNTAPVAILIFMSVLDAFTRELSRTNVPPGTAA
jgi:hypothetical protein